MAVVGGGIAGLCLGRLLEVAEVNVVIFEADASPDARNQGGSLDMHMLTGQRAIRAAGLFEKFQEKVRPGADSMNILNQNRELLYHDDGDGSRPEIERVDLRDIFLNAIKPETIQWGKKLESVQGSSDDGPITLTFEDGSQENATVVIGADGAWSKIRGLLTDVLPEYTGITFIDKIISEDEDISEIPKGTIFVMDSEDNAVLGHIGDQAHIYFAKKCERKELTENDAASVVKGWDSAFQKLATARGTATVRAVNALPVGITWTRDADWKKRVALVGDAAHLMSPFAGEGANLALADAADLANGLIQAVKRGQSLGDAIAKFEKYQLWPRAYAAQRESSDNLNTFFSGIGAQGVANWMRSMFSISNFAKMGVTYIINYVWWIFGYDYFY